jgi:putative heme-binding domain-containing protein
VLRHPLSPPIRYALTQCIHALAPIWQPALVRGTLDFGARVDALALVLSTAGGPESAALLRRLAVSDRFGTRQRDDALVALAEVGEADDLAFILEQPPSGRVIDALGLAARRRNVRPAGDLNRAMAAWRALPDADVRAAALQLAGDWRLASQLPWARRTALEENAPVAERLAAIGTLGLLGKRGATTDLLTLTAAAKPELRVAALTTLARIDLTLAAGKGVNVIAATPDATAAKAALRPFLGEKDGLAALAKAFKAAPPDAELARRVLQALAEEGKNDPALTDVLNVSAGLATQVLAYSPERIARLVEAAQARGDARRGADIFRRPELACTACHQVNGEGGTLGPDLSAIGRVAPPDFIVESVLWPKRSVKEGYMLTRIVAKDGRQVQGTMLRQSKDINIVRELGTGVIYEFRTNEIATRNMAESLMPDGLTSGLTEQQLSDLLRYLMERGK